MEELFKDNLILFFLFAIISIYGYSEFKEYQRVTILYITVYALSIIHIFSSTVSIILLFVSMFVFLEILTQDEMKLRILVNPFYKMIDCLYMGLFQYGLFEEILAVVLTGKKYEDVFGCYDIIYKLLSFLLMIISITNILRQKYVIKTFNEMYEIFNIFPINKVDFNEKLFQANKILTKIEDATYFDRKGYTFLSLNALKCILNEKIRGGSFLDKFKYTVSSSGKFVKNTIAGERGYSTIPMQLIRTLGIKRGYNYKYRRKIFELLYSRMFFEGIKKMLYENKIGRRNYFKEYCLYIYFHTVNTFLENIWFSKFLNAFDMQYSKKNIKDIYDCTNEGIFIACMGLSKRAYINYFADKRIDAYIKNIDIELDKEKICEMAKNMMQKPYNGNYLQ